MWGCAHAEGQRSGIFCNHSSFFATRSFFWTWNQFIWLEWLGIKPQGNACLVSQGWDCRHAPLCLACDVGARDPNSWPLACSAGRALSSFCILVLFCSDFLSSLFWTHCWAFPFSSDLPHVSLASRTTWCRSPRHLLLSTLKSQCQCGLSSTHLFWEERYLY